MGGLYATVARFKYVASTDTCSPRASSHADSNEVCPSSTSEDGSQRNGCVGAGGRVFDKAAGFPYHWGSKPTTRREEGRGKPTSNLLAPPVLTVCLAIHCVGGGHL